MYLIIESSIFDTKFIREVIAFDFCRMKIIVCLIYGKADFFVVYFMRTFYLGLTFIHIMLVTFINCFY